MAYMEMFTQHTITRSSTNNTICIKVSTPTPLVIPRQYPSYAPTRVLQFPYDDILTKEESLNSRRAAEEDRSCHQTNHVFPHWGENSNVMACNERPTGSFAAGGLS
jgi:hypothetical protein